MAKPNAPKDIKPTSGDDRDKQREKELKAGGGNNVFMSAITTILICSLFLLVNYFMQDSLLSKKIVTNTETEETEDVSDSEAERGVIVDLGDFTMNLSDADAKRYLKVSVALELTKTESDLAAESAKPSGGHGESAAPAASPLEAEMTQYKPAIRDAVISALSSKNSAELSTNAGKELAKEEISDAVDSIFAGEREVIRVSFGQFIMQ
jgi:flagellar basal body-associated protein FliL